MAAGPEASSLDDESLAVLDRRSKRHLAHGGDLVEGAQGPEFGETGKVERDRRAL